ncbi:MAG: hypothetical protein ABI584_08235 [Acidobacteriota bacterium]
MRPFARALAVVLGTFLFASDVAFGQDPSKLVTKAEVEKVTAAKFKDGWKPMPTQISFAQEGGDLQISVDLEPRDAQTTVRGWEATMKKMEPKAKVETVPGIGKDAIFYSTRPDMGAVSGDFEGPRVQLRVSVAGAKTPAQAKQIVVDLAKIVAPRVGK